MPWSGNSLRDAANSLLDLINSLFGATSSSTISHKSVNSEADRIEDRIFVDVAPSYLSGLLKDRLDIQGRKLVEPYIGKWLSLTGAVTDVYFDSVMMHLDPIKAIDSILLLLHFDIKWKDRIHTLRENQQISVIGKIKTIREFDITMVHCELIVSSQDNV